MAMRKEDAVDKLFALYMEKRTADTQFVARELVPLGKHEVNRAMQQGDWADVAIWADVLAAALGQGESEQAEPESEPAVVNHVENVR